MKKSLLVIFAAIIAIVGIVLYFLWHGSYTFSGSDSTTALPVESVSSCVFPTMEQKAYENMIKKKYAIKDFEDVSDDFIAIIDLIEPYRAEVEIAEHHFFIVGYEKDFSYISFNDKVIQLNEIQQNSMKEIAKSYSWSSTGAMTLIGVEPGQIIFLSEWKNYAVVYTDDDIMPSTLWFAKAEVRVEKIRPHWYHVFDVR